MEGTQTFHVENMVHSDAPDEYKQHALKWAREQVSRQLFDILWQTKLPAVVDIDEHIDYNYQRDYMRVPNDRIRIVVTMTPVRYRNVEILSTPYGYADWMKFAPKGNIFHRIKKAIINWRKS